MKIPISNQTGSYDFSKMNDKDYYAFRYAFVEEKLFYETYNNNKNAVAIEAILNVLCMVLCKRVPRNVVPYSCDQLVAKIKL